jgi:hypothetical protein
MLRGYGLVGDRRQARARGDVVERGYDVANAEVGAMGSAVERTEG